MLDFDELEETELLLRQSFPDVTCDEARKRRKRGESFSEADGDFEGVEALEKINGKDHAN